MHGAGPRTVVTVHRTPQLVLITVTPHRGAPVVSPHVAARTTRAAAPNLPVITERLDVLVDLQLLRGRQGGDSLQRDEVTL